MLEIVFEDVIYKIVNILIRPQCVNLTIANWLRFEDMTKNEIIFFAVYQVSIN